MLALTLRGVPRTIADQNYWSFPPMSKTTRHKNRFNWKYKIIICQICLNLLSAGHCKVSSVASGCPRSCNLCRSTILPSLSTTITTTTAMMSCSDSSSVRTCNSWSKRGYCNRTSVRTRCRKTCNVCWRPTRIGLARIY